jgi:hypothetical protein
VASSAESRATDRRITVYSAGLVAASVCAPKDAPVEDVEAAANAQHPTGIDSVWRKAADATFKGGEPNPCPCNSDPNRLHWLLSC